MKKITLLFLFFTLAFSIKGFAQFGCESGVVITDGYTASGITTPGTAGAEDWNDNPTVQCGSVSNSYWDDDVYLFTYTAGATDEEVSMTTFSRGSWNGLGIFATCTGTALDGCLDTAGATGSDTTKTVTANISAGETVYIATGQWGTPNNLDFDVIAFSAVPLTSPPSCTALTTPVNGTTDASLNGDITWAPAGGAATDYLLEVGTTTGGTEVFTGQVGDVTTYNVGALMESTTYYVTITPSNSNGVSTGCTEESFTTLTPLPGDSIANPVAFTPSAEGSTCDTAEYTFSYDFTSGYTDSGLDDTCTNTSTGLDIFFSWTATSDALIWNDGAGNPGIAIRDAATGDIVDCVSTFASVDYNLSGWTVGQDLIIQVYDFGTSSVNPLSFCLIQYNLPSLPECAANLIATPDETCGILDTVLSWEAAASADGYNLTVGTTSGGNDILDDVNVGDVTTYNVGDQEVSTTYYWTLTPYNVTGLAVDCAENTYTTNAVNCYCEPSSTNTNTTTFIDNVSTTNGSMDISNLASGLAANHYVDNFASMGVSSYAEGTFDFTVEIQGGTLGLGIWIDWNNDLVYEISENVYTTTSYGNGPFTGTITVPAGTANGDYHMRIMADWSDSTPGDDDACSLASGRGETEDYKVTVVDAPSCTPPTAVTNTVLTDTAAEFTWTGTETAWEYANLVSPSTEPASGTATSTGAASFTSLTPETAYDFYVRTDCGGGVYSTWIKVTYTTIPTPPANDDCMNAEVIIPSTTGEEVWYTGTTFSNTASGEVADADVSCGSFGSGRDVWYTVEVPAAGDITITTQASAGSPLTDTTMSVFSGSCGALVGTEIDCDDDGGASAFSEIVLTGQTPGDILYVRVQEYGAAATNGANDGAFEVSAHAIEPALSTIDFDTTSLFSYYPNPVSVNLTLKAQKEISNVSVYNMIGQEVYRNAPNSVNNSVDMSNLQAGAYFVKVTIDNVTETIKVIKK